MALVSKYDINNICRTFYTYLNEKNFDDINTNILNKYGIDYLSSLENNSLISLIFQFGIDTDNKEIITKIFPFISRRRDYFHFLVYIKEDNVLCEKIFSKNISKDSIIPKDIEFMIENGLSFLIKSLKGLFIKLDIQGEKYSEIKFTKLEFKYSKINFEKICSVVDDKNMVCFLNTIMWNNYNYIIDAGNIMFSRNGILNENSIKDLETVINKYKNSLVIIHSRHLKNEKIKELLNKKIYFPTPLGLNDDIFIIMSYLYNNSKIITNDNYKDHTIENNDLRNFISDDLIKYSNNSGIFIFEEEIKYTQCIQVINDDIYIPANNGFIKISL
jgi:hypothetical protein